jgi:hypothetical protein
LAKQNSSTFKVVGVKKSNISGICSFFYADNITESIEAYLSAECPESFIINGDMIIDGHAHAAGVFFSAETLVPALDELGVDKVVLCQNVRNDPKEVRLPFENGQIANRSTIAFAGSRLLRLGAWLMDADKGLKARNEFVLSLAEKCPDRIIPFYWANPFDHGVLKDLDKALGRDGFRGIKLHQCVTRFSCGDPILNDIAAIASEKNVPIFIHLYSKTEVRRFIAWVRRNPGTQFIVAHLIGLEIMAPRALYLKNIVFDISPAWGSTRDRVKFAAAAFGADHLILGSDTPFGKETLKKNIEKVRNLDFRPEEQALILGRNIARILSLSD